MNLIEINNIKGLRSLFLFIFEFLKMWPEKVIFTGITGSLFEGLREAFVTLKLYFLGYFRVHKVRLVNKQVNKSHFGPLPTPHHSLQSVTISH